MNTDTKQIVFLLYEHYEGTYPSATKHSTLLDIYTDWDKAEQARVGNDIYKDSAWFSYEVVEWELKS